jgi:hypothetical protein
MSDTALNEDSLFSLGNQGILGVSAADIRAFMAEAIHNRGLRIHNHELQRIETVGNVKDDPFGPRDKH